MADSVRKQIIDAAVTALSSSTGIAYVTTKKESWWNWDVSKYPGVCLIANQADRRERFCYTGTDEDMYSELELNILGYAFDINNDLSIKRTDLIRDIERALVNDAALDVLTGDIVPTSIETDQGTLDNYCIVHCKYLAKYIYNHGAP